ncbi:MAG: peptidoglycan-binding protein [Candidatus Nitrotoga sp.]
MLTATQKKTAESLVNIFETGEVLGDYGQVTLIAGDTGHLTFGRSQTTLGSGNLNELMQRYCANSGARFGTRLASYLPRFAARDLKLDTESKLHNLLRASADDNVMRDTQDTFFDETYWQPAAQAAERLQITSPLGVAVVYDSFVHGSWKAMCNRTTQQVGDITSISEQKWIAAYIAVRRAWLAQSSRSDLRATVYRMDAFQRLIDQDYWGLELPLVVRGQEISSVTLSATPRGCYDGPQPGTRSLALQSPLQRGLDVRLLQLGLSDRGVDIKADGIFGQTSLQLIKKYQSTHGLPVTGVADVALIAQLVA